MGRATVRTKNLTEKITALKECKTRHEGLLEELERTGQSQVSLTDPDSRAMASHRHCCICRLRSSGIGVGFPQQAGTPRSLATKRTSPVTPGSTRMHWRLRIIRITSKPLMVA